MSRPTVEIQIAGNALTQWHIDRLTRLIAVEAGSHGTVDIVLRNVAIGKGARFPRLIVDYDDVIALTMGAAKHGAECVCPFCIAPVPEYIPDEAEPFFRPGRESDES